MNLEQIVVEEQETYPDQCKDNDDGAKDSLGWWKTRGLRKIQGFDGGV